MPERNLAPIAIVTAFSVAAILYQLVRLSREPRTAVGEMRRHRIRRYCWIAIWGNVATTSAFGFLPTTPFWWNAHLVMAIVLGAAALVFFYQSRSGATSRPQSGDGGTS